LDHTALDEHNALVRPRQNPSWRPPKKARRRTVLLRVARTGWRRFV